VSLQQASKGILYQIHSATIVQPSCKTVWFLTSCFPNRKSVWLGMHSCCNVILWDFS